MHSILMDALLPIGVDSTRYVVEVAEPYFCDMPKYVWDGIFVVIEVLVVGLLLAYMASKYQHRKEVEWKLRGNLLEKRFESYKKVSSFVYALANQHDPTEEELKDIDALLEHPIIAVPVVKYADIFTSEKKFRDFRFRLDQLIAQEKLFLDYPMLLHLEQMRFYFDAMGDVVEDFIRVQHNPKNKFTSAQIKRHIDIGLKAFGVALNNDMSKMYGVSDQLLAERMRDIEMVPSKYRLDKWCDEWTDDLIEWSQKKKTKGSWLFKFCVWLKIGRWEFFQNGEMLFLVLMGAHYMDRKVSVWDEDPGKGQELIFDFHKQMHER